MTERRYSEEEIAAIFERATEAQQKSQRGQGPGSGLTLPELQQIGREIGITPEVVAQAAQSIDHRPTETSRRFFGVPIAVGRTVELERKLSDDEWERLVVDLRETFDAKGTVRHEGSFRQWTNGNLQALLEPTAKGHRLRLKTEKGDARGMFVGGTGMVGFANFALIAATLQGGISDTGFVAAIAALGTCGLAMLTYGLLHIPRWAKLRQRQMEDISARLTSQQPDDPQS